MMFLNQVSQKQKSYLPPSCSLKTAVANNGWIAKLLVALFNSNADTLSKTLAGCNSMSSTHSCAVDACFSELESSRSDRPRTQTCRCVGCPR